METSTEEPGNESPCEEPIATDETKSKGSGGPPHLQRPLGDRMVAGVAAGIAQYLDLDITLVRIALVILAFAGGVAIPAYAAAWLLIPDEGQQFSLAADLLDHFRP